MPRLPAVAESVRIVSGSSQVALARLDRTVVASSDPSLLGQPLELGESRVMEGRAWTGVVSGPPAPQSCPPTFRSLTTPAA